MAKLAFPSEGQPPIIFENRPKMEVINKNNNCARCMKKVSSKDTHAACCGACYRWYHKECEETADRDAAVILAWICRDYSHTLLLLSASVLYAFCHQFQTMSESV